MHHRRQLAFGVVEPHYFAGWAGAHKTATVGVWDRATITANHEHALAPASQPLALDGNPVYDGLAAAAVAGVPQRLLLAVLGGAKVSDKLAVMKHLLPRVDLMLVGGGMCFTLLAAGGHEIGDSLVEESMVAEVGT